MSSFINTSTLLAFTLLLSDNCIAEMASTRTQVLREKREAFQSQTLITSKPNQHIFNAGNTPEITWRNPNAVRDLGCTGPLAVRWYDNDFKQTTAAQTAGRYTAHITTTAPNGLPYHRFMTFFCRPYGFLFMEPPKIQLPAPNAPALIDEKIWNRHQNDIAATSREVLLSGLNGSEAGAKLLGNLYHADRLEDLPHTASPFTIAQADHDLQLKLKVLGLTGTTQTLNRPQHVPGLAAPALRKGTPQEAGVSPDARQQINEVCEQWYDDAEVPFTIVVARNGVIVIHAAFGNDANGTPVTLDYRCDVASISKCITGMLAALFVDQGLLNLDQSISTVFRNFPNDPRHVPTFRQCFHHMSGLSGHAVFGGIQNPFFENLILNAVDTNDPGAAFIYTGTGYDVVGKAMELITGKTVYHLFHDNLFDPLGISDMEIGGMGSGIKPTALELAAIGQLLLNRGTYGDWRFFSDDTYQKILPTDISDLYNVKTDEIYGMGLNWKFDSRTTDPATAKNRENLFFSSRTAGHGSISQCIYRVDLENKLVITMIRAEGGNNFGAWATRFFEAISESLVNPATGTK